jgi:hypothetical protein
MSRCTASLGRGHPGYAYELLWDGHDTAAPHLTGLIDPATLDTYDGLWSGSADIPSGHGRGSVSPRSGGGQGAATRPNPSTGKVFPLPFAADSVERASGDGASGDVVRVAAAR